MTNLHNRIRFFHYISRVLHGQQADPYCGKCKAFANSVAAVEESLAEWESAHMGELKDLPGDIRHLLGEARGEIATIKRPENALGQKKAGNCKMPEGVCFVKISKKIAEQLEQTPA